MNKSRSSLIAFFVKGGACRTPNPTAGSPPAAGSRGYRNNHKATTTTTRIQQQRQGYQLFGTPYDLHT